MITTDQIGNEVKIESVPRRIISLVPSITEFLFDVGLGDRVVGLTKFCVHPEGAIKIKTKVGGTKKFNFEIIDQLNPDLIVANKEENYQEGVKKLKEHYPVYISDIATLEDSYVMMNQLGEICRVEEKANRIIKEIKVQFDGLMPVKGEPSVLYLIWNKPLMAAGGGTFINTIISKLGFKNVIDQIERYPEIDPLEYLNVDFVFLSSEPFPFSDKHIEMFSVMFPNSRIKLVDGEMFSWYGSRLLKAGNYFGSLISSL